MTTHTLTGTLTDIEGGSLTSAANYGPRAVLVPYAQAVAEDDEVRIGAVELTLDNEFAFTVTVPEGGYRVEVRYYDADRRQPTDWRSPTFLLDDDTDLADIVADSATQFQPDRPETDLGSVSGTVNLSYLWGRQEATLSGNATFTLPEGGGPEIALRVDLNGHTLAIDGAAWHGGAAPDFDDGIAVITFVHWPSGWYAFAVGVAGEPIEVTPAAVTFNDTGNVTTVPATTGVQYKRAGVNVSAGTISPEPAGSITYTAVAKSGYVIASGATVSWTHTYPAPPGWSTLISDTFTASDDTTLVGRTPSPTSAGTTWAAPTTAGNTWRIMGNKMAKSAAASLGRNYIAIPTATRSGLGCAIDYDLTAATVHIQLNINWDDSAFLYVRLTRADAVDDGALIAGQTGGVTISLTGTTTGLPTTGRLGVRCIGTALSILIDDDVVATGTATISVNDAEGFEVFSENTSTSTFDNYIAETYT